MYNFNKDLHFQNLHIAALHTYVTIHWFWRKFRETGWCGNYSVEKYYKTRSRFLRKNQHFSREFNIFIKEVTKRLISKIFFSGVIACLVLFYTVVIEWIFSDVIWRNIFQKIKLPCCFVCTIFCIQLQEFSSFSILKDIGIWMQS